LQLLLSSCFLLLLELLAWPLQLTCTFCNKQTSCAGHVIHVVIMASDRRERLQQLRLSAASGSCSLLPLLRLLLLPCLLRGLRLPEA
jgi:hypothetical protein